MGKREKKVPGTLVFFFWLFHVLLMRLFCLQEKQNPKNNAFFFFFKSLLKVLAGEGVPGGRKGEQKGLSQHSLLTC